MQYVAFFRGINVGGKNIVKMDALKRLFAELGFQRVRSYIQSGNVLFDTDMDEAAAIACIRRGFLDAFQFESAVMLRSAEEISDLVNAQPFTMEEIAAAEASDPAVEHMYVYLFDEAVKEDAILALTGAYAGPDMLRGRGRALFLLCHDSIRHSKLAAFLARLKTPMTARNMKTMSKLAQMMGEGI